MIAKLLRLRSSFWAVRYVRSIVSLFRGFRMSPSVTVFGRFSNLSAGPGSVFARRVRIDLGACGRMTAGKGVWLAADTEIETQSAVVFGDMTTVQRRGSINGSVRVGRSCIFAPNVFVSSGSHPFRATPHLFIREQESRLRVDDPQGFLSDRPVWIQDDCWLGVNSVVCPGVIIGKGSVVGANSVVTRDVSPYTVVAGVPARKIGARLDWKPPKEIVASRESDRIYVLSGGEIQAREGVLGFLLQKNEPFLAIVSQEVKLIRVYFCLSENLKLEIGKNERDATIIDNVLIYDLADAAIEFGGLGIRIAVAKIDRRSKFCISHISCI